MERYCGILQANLRSKSQPWANLNNRLIHTAYLEQLGSRYDLEEELSMVSHRVAGELSKYERVYPGCTCLVTVILSATHCGICALDPLSILRPQRKPTFTPEELIRGKIAGYFSRVIRKQPAEIKRRLPRCMPRWSKVRIADGGDFIRSTSASTNHSLPERNSSYVRVRTLMRSSLISSLFD